MRGKIDMVPGGVVPNGEDVDWGERNEKERQFEEGFRLALAEKFSLGENRPFDVYWGSKPMEMTKKDLEELLRRINVNSVDVGDGNQWRLKKTEHGTVLFGDGSKKDRPAIYIGNIGVLRVGDQERDQFSFKGKLSGEENNLKELISWLRKPVV